MIPVKWWWGYKRCVRWIDDNNPHPRSDEAWSSWRITQLDYASAAFEIWSQVAARFTIVMLAAAIALWIVKSVLS